MDLRSFRHVVRRGFFASALVLGCWGLVLPPTVLAGLDPVESFSVTESETGLSRDYVLQSDGGYLWFGSDGQRGEVGADIIEAAEVLDVRQSGDQIHVRVGVDDGLGGQLVYAFNGSLSESGEPIQGFVTAPSGDSTGIAIGVGEGDGDLSVVVTILVAAVAVSLIGCVYGAITSNCPAECSAACSPNPMVSATPGLCGACTCQCHIP